MTNNLSNIIYCGTELKEKANQGAQKKKMNGTIALPAGSEKVG